MSHYHYHYQALPAPNEESRNLDSDPVSVGLQNALAPQASGHTWQSHPLPCQLPEAVHRHVGRNHHVSRMAMLKHHLACCNQSAQAQMDLHCGAAQSMIEAIVGRDEVAPARILSYVDNETLACLPDGSSTDS